MLDLNFYRGKHVLITGHTGFKGTWLSTVLLEAGAIVTGYSLAAPEFSLFKICDIESRINHYVGDIRDLQHLRKVFETTQPEIVLHLAAQPIVKESYVDPVYTYETNVMGTVNILECVRLCGSVKSFLNVTTDKVYENKEWIWGYRENEPLNGYDPYSNSKSCSELVTSSYKNSFFNNTSSVSISTARAGNVIGGGDFAIDRIIPDCIRAAKEGRTIIVRNPHSTRPYQHVLEPVFAYLLIAQQQFNDSRYAGNYNVGPDDDDCITTGALVDVFCKHWGQEITWENKSVDGPHEANFLKLDCSKLKSIFGWAPHWNVEKAIEKTCEWTKSWLDGANVSTVMKKQIEEYRRS